jgi:hypothetical protein
MSIVELDMFANNFETAMKGRPDRYVFVSGCKVLGSGEEVE